MYTIEDFENNFDAINDATGFASGELFASEDEVRNYFTVENMSFIFGPGREHVETQELLDACAAAVLRNGWHMVGSEHTLASEA